MPGSVGDWRPSAGWPVLALRARLLACSRAFFADRGVTEVETPALVRHAVTDPHLANIPARGGGAPAGGGGGPPRRGWPASRLPGGCTPRPSST